ncbi:AIPR family protein [Chitinophaga barathri]|uniref:AIPR protein n=1 Tax=Chitinophaga barathri TaxID=1647451 RepID=A0A3N4MIH1_9BACT|nr:AIPR family protein [Chitinophaga barathri]RPD39459.1 AIPR protein [Chitinophaga barathri]
MSKYNILVRILDKIRTEAPATYTVKYARNDADIEKANQARARAFIHLYLKVSFGLLDFTEREAFITDDTMDGGIDGYYIHKESKTIYFIQSKFRTTEKNFEQKRIELAEILIMDINRIMDGEENDENGNKYNGKIRQMMHSIREMDDIARYRYKVILLANIENIPQSKLKYLTGGYPVEVFDYELCYNKLIFPILSGTYFNASDLTINIDLSNKNAGSKISYTVKTEHSDCEITLLFVPTIEIAKVLHKYKNSILKYNPRSYLEFEGQKVNSSIRETILKKSTNEFALFNNGITMLSDETYINEKIGQKNKAQLHVVNPQIINGGQTAYTLGKIYEENITKNVVSIFQEKEVLLKIITFIQENGSDEKKSEKVQLIDEISTATNLQTPVIGSDKFSNDKFHVRIQDLLFSRYGLLYERKRGEFGDGAELGYISRERILERNMFFRIYYASNGEINRSIQKKLFLKNQSSIKLLENLNKLDNFYFGYYCFNQLLKKRNQQSKIEKNIYGMVYAMTRLYKPDSIVDYQDVVSDKISIFPHEWEKFTNTISKSDPRYMRTFLDKRTEQLITTFSEVRWYRSNNFEEDILNFYGTDERIFS